MAKRGLNFKIKFKNPFKKRPKFNKSSSSSLSSLLLLLFLIVIGVLYITNQLPNSNSNTSDRDTSYARRRTLNQEGTQYPTRRQRRI